MQQYYGLQVETGENLLNLLSALSLQEMGHYSRISPGEFRERRLAVWKAVLQRCFRDISRFRDDFKRTFGSQHSHGVSQSAAEQPCGYAAASAASNGNSQAAFGGYPVSHGRVSYHIDASVPGAPPYTSGFSQEFGAVGDNDNDAVAHTVLSDIATNDAPSMVVGHSTTMAENASPQLMTGEAQREAASTAVLWDQIPFFAVETTIVEADESIVKAFRPAQSGLIAGNIGQDLKTQTSAMQADVERDQERGRYVTARNEGLTAIIASTSNSMHGSTASEKSSHDVDVGNTPRGVVSNEDTSHYQTAPSQEYYPVPQPKQDEDRDSDEEHNLP